VQITPPAALAAGTDVPLNAKVNWLMCQESCIPGKALVSLQLPVRAEPAAPDPAQTSRFALARAALPEEAPDWTFSFTTADAGPVLRIEAPSAIDQAYFFPADQDALDYASTQELSRDGSAYVLALTRSSSAEGPITNLNGVLQAVSDKTSRYLVVHAIESAAPAPASAVVPDSVSAPTMTLGAGLLAMFLGGLLLNLMPCVFPVLSIKIVGFVEQAREEHTRPSSHAFAFTAGVMVSMWVLAALLLALRDQGAQVGWAFQMSNPHFVLALILLFLALGLNLFGVFEMGLGLTAAGGKFQSMRGLAGSFFSGLLTTVAGAPCAGPFLGTAIGFALSQSNAAALLAFTAMGLGTAAPYAILSCFPGLLKFIPKPGAWMETMKQLMGFPMLATAAWFAGTFAKLNGGVDGLVQLLFGCVFVAMGAWVLGTWGALHRSTASRWTARIAALAFVVLGARVALHRSELVFEPWSAQRVEELRAAGKPAFVDFTAEWCAICQVNKRLAIEDKGVVRKFRDLGVTVLVADWTDQNEEVTRGLQAFNRAAVPLYVLYTGDARAPPVVLPQTLTPGLITETLEKNIRR
jgi:thiol:disulfide interchange protein DsbD